MKTILWFILGMGLIAFFGAILNPNDLLELHARTNLGVVGEVLIISWFGLSFLRMRKTPDEPVTA